MTDSNTNFTVPLRTVARPLSAILLCGLLVACGSSGTDETTETGKPAPSLALSIPASLTGGTTASPRPAPTANAMRSADPVSMSLKLAKAGTGEPCAYTGNEDDDNPFRNGYETSKFMISTMATWTCVADLLVDISAYVEHDGTIIETDNDNNSPGFEADEPTHYSVTDDSDTQVTIRMYYNYSRSQPPIVGEKSQFYISWNEDDLGRIQGRMIIDGEGVAWKDRKPGDPVNMRMDFDFTSTNKTADMYLQFDATNPWADGLRLQISKDLNANPLLKVFEARGLLAMNAQFAPALGISEVPDIHLYTVADALGNGASIAEFQDVSLPLVLNQALSNNLGNYLFSKKDIYYFDDDMDWDYINKTVISSEYRGHRTTPATGGSWLLPFDPSLDQIITGLNLDTDYFTGNKCALIGDDCNALLNATFDFVGGFAGQEENQGSDPLDWRSVEINNAQYLTSVYPNGIDWTGAFDHVFVPVNP